MLGHLPELIIVLVLALIFFGPQKLPEMAASLGKGIRDFKASIDGLEQHVNPAPISDGDSFLHPEKPESA
jgi:TatA/E family protein of Tat protein translocase